MVTALHRYLRGQSSNPGKPEFPLKRQYHFYLSSFLYSIWPSADTADNLAMTFDTTPRFQPWEPPWHLIASVAFSYRVIVSLSFLGEQRLQFWRFILVRKSTYREKGPCIALPWTLIWTKSSQLKECLEALLDCKRSTSNYTQNLSKSFSLADTVLSLHSISRLSNWLVKGTNLTLINLSTSKN